ncbi:MAG: hypothetical protein ABII00_05370 [Elusimicrobiota bacterium]
MAKRKTEGREKKGKAQKSGEGISGTYVYDEESGKIVKKSDRIPGVASHAGSGSGSGPDEAGPCGGCAGGPCPMAPG